MAANAPEVPSPTTTTSQLDVTGNRCAACLPPSNPLSLSPERCSRAATFYSDTTLTMKHSSSLSPILALSCLLFSAHSGIRSMAADGPPHKLPLLLNALNYSGQPDLKAHQLGDVVMIYETEMYPDVPDRAQHTYPTAAGWANFDARVAAAAPGTPVCLDLELHSHPGYPWKKGRDWEEVVDLFRRIAVEAKSRSGGRPVGFYGMFPIDNAIPNASLNESVHPRAEMQAHNDLAAPAIAEIDILFPCNYRSGTGYDDHSNKVMKSIAAEAARIAPGKPCYLFCSPQQQNTATQQYPDLSYETALGYFGDVIEIYGPIGGGILWGGYDIGVPKREDDANLQLQWPGFSTPWMVALLKAIDGAGDKASPGK